jgi:hypothetical protein
LARLFAEEFIEPAGAMLLHQVNPIQALKALLNLIEISFDHCIEKSERQNPETGTGLFSSGLRVLATIVLD